MNAASEPMAILPFCRGNVLVPRHDRRSAVAAMALAAPTRASVVRLHRLLARAVGAAGPWWLRRSRGDLWPEWLGAEGAGALLEDLRRSVGRFDAMAIHVPRQRDRRSLALLLLRDGVPLAFAKVKPDPAPLDREAAAMGALAGQGPAALRVAQPIASGDCGVHWLATTPLDGPHEPAIEEPGPVYEQWVHECLAPVLGPAAVPPHWRVAHGDLSPWNLRRRGGSAWLLDWEAVTWAPPCADRAYFRAASAVVRGGTPMPVPREAVEYWLTKVRARPDASAPLNRRLLEVLPGMAQDGS